MLRLEKVSDSEKVNSCLRWRMFISWAHVYILSTCLYPEHVFTVVIFYLRTAERTVKMNQELACLLFWECLKWSIPLVWFWKIIIFVCWSMSLMLERQNKDQYNR